MANHGYPYPYFIDKDETPEESHPLTVGSYYGPTAPATSRYEAPSERRRREWAEGDYYLSQRVEEHKAVDCAPPEHIRRTLDRITDTWTGQMQQDVQAAERQQQAALDKARRRYYEGKSSSDEYKAEVIAAKEALAHAKQLAAAVGPGSAAVEQQREAVWQQAQELVKAAWQTFADEMTARYPVTTEMGEDND